MNDAQIAQIRREAAQQAEKLRAEMLARELAYIEQLSQDEQLKYRVKRIARNLMDTVMLPGIRYIGVRLIDLLNYTSEEEYKADVMALVTYVGATLALDPDPEERKKKPRRKCSAKAGDDFERTPEGRIKGAYTPDGFFEPE